ncbi:hypothetical protein PM082_014416 [Marasmius tenuissimus]|nr:hypothetical protein PM082_014416 [Marasmius tenuissimus]
MGYVLAAGSSQSTYRCGFDDKGITDVNAESRGDVVKGQKTFFSLRFMPQTI